MIVTGRFRTPELAEAVLAAGDADFVGLGRALLADPDWARKAHRGRAEEIRPCIGIVQDCRRSIGLIACTIHARTGREREWEATATISDPRRVVVAGGGPAGMETARLAAESGHDVVLFERSEELGGQLLAAAAAPTRAEVLDFVHYGEREMGRLGVDVRLGTCADATAVLAMDPDLLVCATGARPRPPEFPISGGAEVFDVWQLLGGGVTVRGEHAVVVDDGAGFWHGVGAVEFLAARGLRVGLVTRARGVALTIPHESAGNTLRRMRAKGVHFHPLVNVTSVAGRRVELADSITGDALEPLEADLVVVRTELRADATLASDLDGQIAAIAVIGDCAAPRRLTHAVLDANRTMRRFNAGQLSGAATFVV